MIKSMAADDVIDLAAMGGDEAAHEEASLASLKRNLAHLRISSIKHDGPEIDFGQNAEGVNQVLKFKAKVPATAMAQLIGDENRVEGLRSYIRLTLIPESRPVFEDLLDDLPLDALNAIVEVISEASTTFPTK